MRVGELTASQHVVKAKNVHMATNKNKLLLVLYSSKTHSTANRPQRIRITANSTERSGKYLHRHFCPFTLLRKYISTRGPYDSDEEQFFIFKDKSPVTADMARTLLRRLISNLGLNSELYNMHSLRIGRASDLIKYKYPIEEILQKLISAFRETLIVLCQV